MKDPMQKKIIDAAAELKKKCLAADCAFIAGGHRDPQLTESFEKFVSTLNEAEDKKMYTSLMCALKKISQRD